MTEHALLGLGSNLGDRLGTLQRAVDLLAAEPGISPSRCSRVWETDPVGGPPQPDFLNVVLRVEVDGGGKAVAVEVERSSGHRLLDDTTRRQVLDKRQFVPAMRDGVAVPAVGLLPFDFTIPRG